MSVDGLCRNPDGTQIENCTVVEPDDPFGSDMDSGIPGSFIALFVLMILAGLAITAYKVSMSRDMARRSGLDPDEATAMTLLDEDGLSTTYLSTNLRTAINPTLDPSYKAPEPGAERTVEQRLAELESLRDRGLITQVEYDEQRAQILDSI